MFGGFFMKYKIKNKLFDKKLLKSLCVGIICGLAAVTILTLLCAIIINATGLYPDDVLSYIVLVFLGVGALIGGYIAARLNKASGMAVGALTGFIIFLIIFITGISQSHETLTLYTLLKLIVLIVFSGLGGILGVNKQNKIKI